MTTAPFMAWTGRSAPDPRAQTLLRALGEAYPVVEGPATAPLELAVEIDAGCVLSVSRKGRKAAVRAPSPSQAARGVGLLLAGLVEDGGQVEQPTHFKTRGLLLDCSRNAVFSAAYLKQVLCKMALLGYDTLLLYTKDTYRLPGEDYFGYLRGAYTADTLRELDDCAERLGIRMVGCIQALGHLEPVLRWPAYAAVRDTISVLMPGHEQTRRLVEKMLDFYASVYRGRRIHVGMDETHGLGRGQYLDRQGYRPAFDLYGDHLDLVASLCRERGLQPIIWSDMFFRLGSKRMDYYDPESRIPPEAARRMPPGVQWAYWDYYHTDEAFYREWIRRHKAVGPTPLMASGLWTWPQLWYQHEKTAATIAPCLSACAAEGVDEILFALWGDDGACCEWDSTWAGAAYAAERLFNGNTEPDPDLMERVFASLSGESYRTYLIPSRLSILNKDDTLHASALLWDDPLLGIYWKEKALSRQDYWRNLLEHYRALRAEWEAAAPPSSGATGHADLLMNLLRLKVEIQLALHDGWARRDRETLARIAGRLPELIELHRRLAASFRERWYARCAPQGFEVIQHRLAGLVARYEEVGLRLAEWLQKGGALFPELTESVTVPRGVVATRYDDLATASVSSVTIL